jgi:hypothetical protein
MSRLQTYLISESRAVSISKEEAINLLNNECSDAFNTWKSNNKSYIFRGNNSNVDYTFLDPKNIKERQAKRTYNYYNWIINNSTLWKKYPNRQIICSAGKEQAIWYGKAHHIFPYNDTKIGVSPVANIWNAFDNKFKLNLADLNNLLYEIFSVYNNKDVKSYQEMISVMKSIKDIKKLKVKDTSFFLGKGKLKKIKEDVSEFGSLYDWYLNILDPNKSNHKIITVGDNLLNQNLELWFDNKCVIILDESDIIRGLL